MCGLRGQISRVVLCKWLSTRITLCRAPIDTVPQVMHNKMHSYSTDTRDDMT